MINANLWSDLAAGIQQTLHSSSSNRPVLLLLGGYTFSVATVVYQELARVNEYR